MIALKPDKKYEIPEFPEQWRFVPIAKGKKSPIGKRWHAKPYTLADVPVEGERLQVENDRGGLYWVTVGAVGVLTGEISGGLLLVDCDGATAKELLIEWAGEAGEKLPDSWVVTSGRPGRGQIAFWVPKQFWGAIETRKYKSSQGDFLELRWNGCQSLVRGLHPSGSRYHWLDTDQEIAIAPYWLLEKMLFLPETTKNNLNWKEFDRNFRLPVDSPIPLEICLSRSDQELIKSGAGNGSRNNSGIKLAINLIATADYFDSIGQRYEGIPEQLFDQFCRACPGEGRWNQREWDSIWKSAQKQGGGTTLTPEAIENCIKAFYWKKIKEKSDLETIQRKIIDFPINSPANSNLPTPKEQVEQLLAQNLSQSELQSLILSIAKGHGVSSREIWALYYSCQQEQEERAFLDNDREELEKLVKISNYEPTCQQFIGSNLGGRLDRYAELTGTAPLAILATLLSATASLTAIGTQLELIRATNFYALPILWTIIVSTSGGGKSPAQKVITRSLYRLQSSAYQKYQNDLENWRHDSKTAKSNDEDPPPKPKLKHYITTDATSEGILRIQSEQPGNGFLIHHDEVSALFNSQNAYRNGKGADKEKLLSGRDGGGAKADRAGKDSVFVDRVQYSITGTTQCETLKRLMAGKGEDFADHSGQFARFSPILMQVRPAPFSDDGDENLYIDELLDTVFQRLESFQSTTYKLSEEARALYRDWYNELDGVAE